ncbi:hypothetical protein [Varibaculum massiliense]|nr:hypothetical protein [Varibaculum massiliense]
MLAVLALPVLPVSLVWVVVLDVQARGLQICARVRGLPVLYGLLI